MKVNIQSPCIRGCKHSEKCYADKSTVVECKRYEPTEEYKKHISELVNILKESEKERVNESNN